VPDAAAAGPPPVNGSSRRTRRGATVVPRVADDRTPPLRVVANSPAEPVDTIDIRDPTDATPVSVHSTETLTDHRPRPLFQDARTAIPTPPDSVVLFDDRPLRRTDALPSPQPEPGPDTAVASRRSRRTPDEGHAATSWSADAGSATITPADRAAVSPVPDPCLPAREPETSRIVPGTAPRSVPIVPADPVAPPPAARTARSRPQRAAPEGLPAVMPLAAPGATRQTEPAGPLPAGPTAQEVLPDEPMSRPAGRPAPRHRAPNPAVEHLERVRVLVDAGSIIVVLVAGLLWVSGGGVAALASPVTAVASVGLLAGSVGSALLAVLVVLGAGIPDVEAAFGRQRLLKRHMMLGTLSFALVVAHVLLAVAASALVEEYSIFEAAWYLVSDLPWFTLAAVGVALLTLVVASSRRTARATRRRDSWHVLHLYGYLGVALALPHQILTAAPAAAVFWTVLFVLALVVIAVWRIQRPLSCSFRHQIVVQEVVPEAHGAVSVHLRGRALEDLGVRAGSALRLRFLDGRRWFTTHVGVVSARPTGGRMRVTMPIADADDRVTALTKGTWVLVEGPSGALTGAVRTRRRLALFASGLGIAPMRGLLEELEFDAGEAIVVHRSESEADAPFHDEIAAIATRRGVDTVSLAGPAPTQRRSWLPDDAAGHIGDVEAVLHLVPDVVDRDVFVSGPPEWVHLVVDAVRRAGVPARQVHADSLP
jgi:ferredoxin-NADP reductase/DMSO/TMAO reductase YedYZ heme-binding membrane subunit